MKKIAIGQLILSLLLSAHLLPNANDGECKIQEFEKLKFLPFPEKVGEILDLIKNNVNNIKGFLDWKQGLITGFIPIKTLNIDSQCDAAIERLLPALSYKEYADAEEPDDMSKTLQILAALFVINDVKQQIQELINVNASLQINENNEIRNALTRYEDRLDAIRKLIPDAILQTAEKEIAAMQKICR